MILIEFPDRDTEVKGLAILMSRFSGKVLRGGFHIVPEPALEALTAANIPYTVTSHYNNLASTGASSYNTLYTHLLQDSP